MNNSKNQQTAFVYLRAYKKEKKNLFSIQDQENAISKFVLANGYTVIETFRDENSSGGNFNRHGFQRMLKCIRANPWRIKFIIVLDTSRLSLNTGAFKDFRRKFLKIHGVRVVSLSSVMAKYTDNQRR
jgi:DNA invertase Pin-like site-specific DNA recombinase